MTESGVTGLVRGRFEDRIWALGEELPQVADKPGVYDEKRVYRDQRPMSIMDKTSGEVY